MKCWHCKNEIIWGGDHDYEDYGMEGEGIVSNFSCSKCEATYECYLPLEGQDDQLGEFYFIWSDGISWNSVFIRNY